MKKESRSKDEKIKSLEIALNLMVSTGDKEV